MPLVIGVLVAGTLLVFGVALGTVGINYFSQALREQAIARGHAISSTLASSLVEIIAAKQDAAVGEAIRSVKTSARLAYVEVVHRDGTLVAHTWPGEPPARPAGARTESQRITDATVDGKQVIDVPAKLITGDIIHVGLDRSAIDASVANARLAVLLMTLAEVLVALAATFWISRPFVRQLEVANEDLHEAMKAAEAASEAKSDFLASVSHEIRTPMSGVIGMTGLLLDTKLSADQRELAESVRTSAEALLILINDLLDFSRIEAGKLTIRPAPFDLAQTLDQVAGVLSPKAGEKGIELVVQYPPSAPRYLVGDAGRIRQVLLNLVGNAVKFTAEGRVVVTVEEESDRAAPDMASIRISVEDSGIGIPTEMLGRIFERFVQVDASATRRFEGTGLGLAICRELVEKMGGHIGVSSTLGTGSTFWISLPLPRAARSAAALTEQPERSLREASGRVLLAEDKVVNQRVAATMLEKLGCDVTIAQNGQEAIDMAAAASFDLIFMDCRMPGVDGYEATAAIRRTERSARVPIVAMTAQALERDKEKCLASGMDDYLVKPVSLTGLRDMLDKWLPAPSGPRASIEARPPEPIQTPGADDFIQRIREMAAGVASTSPTFALDVMAAFQADANDALVAMRNALEHGDAKSLALAAHGLKGTSATLGAQKLAGLSAELEKTAHTVETATEKDRGDVAARIAELAREIRGMEELFDEERLAIQGAPDMLSDRAK